MRQEAYERAHQGEADGLAAAVGGSNPISPTTGIGPLNSGNAGWGSSNSPCVDQTWTTPSLRMYVVRRRISLDESCHGRRGPRVPTSGGTVGLPLGSPKPISTYVGANPHGGPAAMHVPWRARRGTRPPTQGPCQFP